MKLKVLDKDFCICKVNDLSKVNFEDEYLFISKTDEEISIVCDIVNKPCNATHINDGWKAFRIDEVLDFSLVGILAKISNILAENNISLFAISTFNTDYILIKDKNLKKAVDLVNKIFS